MDKSVSYQRTIYYEIRKFGLIEIRIGFFLFMQNLCLLLQIVLINQTKLVVHHADQINSDANLVNASKRALCVMERHK